MKASQANQAQIDAVRLLLNLTSSEEGKKLIIQTKCKNLILNDAFVEEFKNILTPEIFSTSYRVDPKLAQRYPDLFSKDILLNSIRDNANRLSMEMASKLLKDKDLTYSDFFREIVEDEHMDEFSEEMDDDEVTAEITRANRPRKKTNLLFSVVASGKPESFEDIEMVVPFLNLNSYVDELIMKRVPEPVRNEILNRLLNKDTVLSDYFYGFMTSEMKEKAINKESANPEQLMAMLNESPDYGWIIHIIDEISSGNINVARTGSVFNQVLIKFFSKIPEDQIVKFILATKDSFVNAYSFDVMKWLLNEKVFTDEQLKSLEDVSIHSGTYRELKKCLEQNNYNF